MLPKNSCVAISFFCADSSLFFFSSCLRFENRLMKENIFFCHVGGRRRTFVVFSSSVFKRKYFTFNLNF